MVKPVLVALDFPDLETARELALDVKDHVGGYKVGLELLMAEGPSALDEIASLGLPVFADVKLHDIPNTVENAAARLADRGVRWITVHASGGRRMLEAAVSGAGSETGVLAVTVLTSLDADDLEDIGVARSVGVQVASLASLASESGAEGVICSPHEVSAIKRVDKNLLAVTPGVRTIASQSDDQKRVMTPAAAIAEGADLLVVGRAITGAEDPAEAAALIVGSLNG